MTLEDSVRQSLADHAKGGPTLQGDPDLSEGRDLADLVLSAGATAAALWTRVAAAAAHPSAALAAPSHRDARARRLGVRAVVATRGPRPDRRPVAPAALGHWHLGASGAYGILKRHGLPTRGSG